MAETVSTLVVAVDVGMTCTGVAFAIKNAGMEMPEPHTIQSWPGNSGGTRDKVPTCVSYSANGRTRWGFLAQTADDREKVHEWFKVFFDKTEYDRACASSHHPEDLPPSHEDVKQYYEDFLRCLYKHIKTCLIDNVRVWSEACIEFLFSVPTTWTKLGLTQIFRDLARKAGFGSEGPNHKLEVGLTEAEAAAVYTFNSQNAVYSDGDIFMVVDAGGGTTDVALLRVEGADGQSATLRSLDQVRGDEIGSVEIDIDFADLVERRLESISGTADLINCDIRKIAEKMSRSNTGFRGYKEEFGTEDSLSQPEYRIELPELPATLTAESAGIHRGKMIFSQDEIRALFDRQIAKIIELLDYQISRMDSVAPGSRISHLVLSGGLGSSQYVKNELIHRYNVSNIDRRAPEMRIISSTRPQLAVVKGLVQDRMKRLKTNKSVLRTRTCRQSLGVLCWQEYNARRSAHQQARLAIDEIDQKTYAKDQVVWFVKQGQQIEQDRDSVDRSFHRTFLKGQRQPWESVIVICNSHVKELPDSLIENDGAVKKLCTMRSDLTALPDSSFKKHKKHWWNMGKKLRTHYEASYTIRFQLKPAGIDTQLLFEGVQYSLPNSFEVRWEAGADMAAPKEHRKSSQNSHDRYRG